MEIPLSDTKKPKVPPWATQPFHGFLAQTERIMQLLHLCIRGISSLRGMPDLIDALYTIEEIEDENNGPDYNSAKKEAELAQLEIDEDFPLLHAQFIITLWSSLECLIRQFLVGWLQNYERAIEVKEIQRIQVKIGEYERLEGYERYAYILDRLEQEISIPLLNGVNRFENLLAPFGLSGSIDDNIRKDLFELNQVRNVIVHRSGIADRRFVESCPWLNLKIGDLVKINYQSSKRYYYAVQLYNIELIIRIGEYFGKDMTSTRDNLNHELLTLYAEKKQSVND